MLVFRSESTKFTLGVGAVVGLGVLGAAYMFYRRSDSTKMKVTELLSQFNKPWIHIKYPEKVEAILSQLIEGGKEKLQVVADFDYTLSKHTHKGQKCSSTHNILDQSPLLPKFFREKACEIRDTYYPIEINPKLSLEEKYPFMVEWWTKAHALLVQCNMRREYIPQMIRDCDARLRDGSEWSLGQLNKHQVPLLIFSAGLGDIIEEIIRQHATLHENIKIVSNYMDFNHQGVCIGFKGEMIHVFNKNENAIHDSDYFDRLSHRTNIILLGDSLGDLHIADGAPSSEEEPVCKLKIGFLNTKVDESLEQYKERYDIVLVKDESLDVFNAVLKKLL